MFPSSKKSEITHFHVVVVKRRLRNVQKKCDGRAKLLFCRSRCRFCRRCLSSLFGTVTSNDADGSENVEKTIGFILSKTTTLHVHHAFCTFLCPFLHDYDAFYGLRKQASTKFISFPELGCGPKEFYGLRKQASTKFCFFFLNLGMVPWNSIPGGLAIFDKVSG